MMAITKHHITTASMYAMILPSQLSYRILEYSIAPIIPKKINIKLHINNIAPYIAKIGFKCMLWTYNAAIVIINRITRCPI